MAVHCGCSGAPPPAAQEPPEENLRQLAYLYGSYMAAHHGQSPANREAFENYLNQLKGDKASRFKVPDSTEKLFVSPRDNQPYVVAYGKPFGTAQFQVVAFEKVGVEGKRFIADALANVQEFDEPTFKQYVPNAP